MRKGSTVKVNKVKSKELVLQFFVVFLKCTLERRLEGFQQLILSEEHITSVQKHIQKPTINVYNKLKPYFGSVNADTIKETFENSTQWAVTSTRFPMRKHFKSRFPAFNIPRRNEAVATDTRFSDTMDSGITMAQIFVGKDSLVSDVYSMQSSKHLGR